MLPADLRPLGDAELARRITAQPAAASELEAELFRRFAPRVRLYGLRHLRSAPAADDLVQNVLVLTLQKLRQGAVREPERLGSFILGTARTMARDLRRAERVTPCDAAPEPSVPGAESDPRLRERLAACVQSLAERERAVVVLSFFQEQGSEEIGLLLGMQAVNVRVARHRALGRLRDCLAAGSQEAA